MKTAVLLAATLMPHAVLAQATAFEGIWCGEGTLYVETDGLGMNDNTVCDFAGGPVISSTTYAATIDCRTVYVTGTNDDGSFQVTEMPLPGPVEILLTLTDPDHLTVLLTGPGQTPGSPTPVYERCD